MTTPTANPPRPDDAARATAGAGPSQPVLYRLLTWFSSTYPIGSFAYSHGLEAAIDAGWVTTAEDVADWLQSVLCDGTGRNDGLLLAAAHRAITQADDGLLLEVAELGQALTATAELALESHQQGGSFLSLTQTAWPCQALTRLERVWAGPYAFPVVAGTACAGHHIARDLALGAYLHGFAANLVSAAVRAIPLGQTAGQVVLAQLEPAILSTADSVQHGDLGDLGSACLLADLFSMKHETQHSRLFRS